MMDKQLTQAKAIEALHRQVETSDNSARDAQGFLRANQEQQQQQQQSRLLPPSSYPSH
jgi:cell fate (sporulation/competence/biofilm development) regulator YlbF (YheA/YmcA/DUF963 family)